LDFLQRCFQKKASKRATISELLEHPWMQLAEDSAVDNAV
jgi:serine/threonine protein kinase